MKKLSLLFTAFLLAACSMPTPEPLPSTTTTPTSVMPTVTMIPTVIPSIVDGQTSVSIALVDPVGEPGPGTFGCGDRIVMVNRPVTTTTPLQTALNELFSIHTYNYGESGLINALADSDIHVENVTITDGHAQIDLAGTTSLRGTCDSPRLEEQIRRTVLQFSSIHDYHVTFYGSERDWRCRFDMSGNCR